MNDEERDDFELTPDDPEAEEKAEGKVARLRKELEQCRTEKQENLDGWQRAKADYVNALKRFEEEKKVERQRGVVRAASALLPAFDALERAKEHGDIPEGFSGIVKQLENGFGSLELTSFGQAGEEFDPALHEALGQDPSESADQEGTVSAVLEKGWKIGDTIIRPAKVRVYFA